MHFVRGVFCPALITESDESEPSFLAAAVSWKIDVFDIAEFAEAITNVTFIARESEITQKNFASFSIIASHSIAWPDRASLPFFVG